MEWVSRGGGLPKPEPSPTMKELIETYAAKTSVTAEEIRRCKTLFGKASRSYGIATVRELTHDHVVKYEKHLANEANLSPKSVKHRYCRIRTVIAYAMSGARTRMTPTTSLERPANVRSAGADALDPNPVSPGLLGNPRRGLEGKGPNVSA